MLRCFRRCFKNCSFLPTRAYQSAPTNASVADGWMAGLPTTCPLPFCLLWHFAFFAILPTFPFCHFASCPLMQMVNLGPKCALSNYNFLIGLQIKSAPQTIMGIVRVKWSIMTWHHHILTKQELIWLLTRLNFGFLNRTVKSIPESQISRRPKNSSTDFNICYLFDKFYPGDHKCNASANALALTSKWDDLLHQIVIQSTISMASLWFNLLN